MGYHYTGYGLEIVSELELPELRVAETGPARAPEVEIRLGAVARDGLPGGEQISPFVWVAQDLFWLEVHGVARFLVADGCRITVDPAPGIDAASVRVFLLGSILGALLFQRGVLALHGNAIEVDGKCMVCVGPSGAGKSTLAAAFAQRGYHVLADDVVAIDAACAAVPGYPRIKLWQDTADRLGIDTGDLMRIRPTLDKFNLPTGMGAGDAPVPVRWVYVLNPGNGEAIELVPIAGLKRFAPLRANTYRRRFMEGMALRPEHLQRCGELAGRIHMARVDRPERGFEIDALVERLLADMAEHG